jgi:hypothetical protein
VLWFVVFIVSFPPGNDRGHCGVVRSYERIGTILEGSETKNPLGW